MTDRKADWIPITAVGDAYEVEMDVRAREGSPQQYRHRPLTFTGQAQHDWTFGEPDSKDS